MSVREPWFSALREARAYVVYFSVSEDIDPADRRMADEVLERIDTALAEAAHSQERVDG